MSRAPTYLWFDTEYTTLDLDRAELLQVALVVTDEKLERLTDDPGINLYLRIDEETEVAPWVADNLAPLLERCRRSELGPGEVDRALADYVDAAIGPPAPEERKRPVLAGNSIHCDWILVRRHLPLFAARINYRLLDVTALKLEWDHWIQGSRFDKDSIESIRRWRPDLELDEAAARHDAYYDVLASLAELAYYRSRWPSGS